MAANKRPRVHLASVEELLGAPEDAKESVLIRVDQIFPFENHPFQVRDDEDMEDLVESIREHGVLTPVLVRPDDEGTYEMISGHRRLHAAKLAGLTVIPAIVRNMTQDEATIAMVDSNIQRIGLLPSEKAYALSMKMDALRRQGVRLDISDDGRTTRTEDKTVMLTYQRKTAEAVGGNIGLKGRQVQNYIRLTKLNRDLLNLVDEKRIPMMLGVTISYLPDEMQNWVYEYYRDNGVLRIEQIEHLKENENLENLTQYTTIQILNEGLREITKVPKRKISLTARKLDHYFPKNYSVNKREQIIMELLETWKEEHEDEFTAQAEEEAQNPDAGEEQEEKYDDI